MVGLGNPLTWSSSCHGAGRCQSRTQSRKLWDGKNAIKYMEKQGIYIRTGSSVSLAEEMPTAYKNIEHVIDAVQIAKLATGVARLIPHLVVKG